MFEQARKNNNLTYCISFVTRVKYDLQHEKQTNHSEDIDQYPSSLISVFITSHKVVPVHQAPVMMWSRSLLYWLNENKIYKQTYSCSHEKYVFNDIHLISPLPRYEMTKVFMNDQKWIGIDFQKTFRTQLN